MKVIQKYFLALVPEGEFQEQVTKLKLEIRNRYQAKYALKSPAHITVKMPFSYNEAKEDKLIERLGGFISKYPSMILTIKGVKTFGERVIYLEVEAGQELYGFQQELKTFCKRELNLVDELSDRNFHPHVTIAFKDIKKSQFQNILQFSSEMNLTQKLLMSDVMLMKRVDGVWLVHKKIKLG
ncbi:2'-5' RNA ligase family protein [Algoriphagus sp. C2-6-M1]|uniref:2'-5' RNA ligase family protein n=1 Tax=Algoriphagus persicinus TaxID=3108754 RepID=UPI002B3B1DAB|nr:2'-5' RNA ligase family protein [Algoriphagus sp. C2-6-M1]MEB2782547.1 2'-5' RNA ligase family protein [Algoriphagus sp. C2-6-M1]